MLISTNANLGLLSQLALKQNRRGTSPTSHVARVSYLLYALFYWVFDILGVRRGTGLIALFGRHSLLAYMCIETTCRSVLWVAAAVVLGGTDRRIGHGLTRFFEGPAAGLCMNIAIVTILCIVLACWERWQNLNAERRRGDGDRT